MKACKWILISLLISLSAIAQASKKAPSPFIGLGVVVADIEQATQSYNQLLGIQQWRLIDLRTKNGGLRFAKGTFKGKTIELIQPLYGESLAASFLKQHGPGIFHLEVDKNFKTKFSMADETAISIGDHWLEQPAPYRVDWYDSYEKLGVYVKKANRRHYEKDFWGEKSLPAQKLPLSNGFIQQLGIVVKDAEATAKEWQTLMGLKPWVFVDFKPPMVSNGQYRGAKGEGFSHVHVGYGQFFDLQIELLQPVAGPTPHRDYLWGSGQGAHHISLGRLKSHDQLSQHYQQRGVRLQMQSDNGGDGRTASYFSTERQLGTVLEFTRPFQGLGNLRIVKALGMDKKLMSKKSSK